MKWPAWRAGGGTRKLQVKVSQLKLEVVCKDKVEDDKGSKIVVAEVKWKGPKAGVRVPFPRPSAFPRNRTVEGRLRQGKPIEWNDEFERVCSFSVSKDGSLGPWNVSFNVLYRENAESRSKFVVLGKASLNLAELASKTETRIERKLPLALPTGRLARDATLSVSVSFVEVRHSVDTTRTGLNSDEFTVSEPGGPSRFLTRTGSCNVSLTSAVDFGSFRSAGAQVDRVERTGSFSWKRLFSVRAPKGRVEPEHSGALRREDASGFPIDQDAKDDNGRRINWEASEVVSRDGQAQLKTNVFFASFDQMSQEAAGEGACAVIVTVIAHWLQSNRGLPTRSEFERLIRDGSREWRELCKNDIHEESFPDKHFDLQTVLEANLRPLSTSVEIFIGFFSPEKFESLKEALSFDEIWNKIKSNTGDGEPSIYIVSWNDHFFVLKVEADAYYIIDSFGERLSEGCTKAFILKFDDSSLMYETVEKDRIGSEETGSSDGVDHMKIICRGKECCKEFIKRFLAAIPVRELEEEKEKGTESIHLHRLQIEFNLCSSLFRPSSSTLCSKSG